MRRGGGGRQRVRVEHMASVHVEHSTTFPRLGWQTFRDSRGKCLPAKDGFVRMPMPLPFLLSLSPFHPPPDGLIGRRETRKVRERKVQNCDRSSWSTRLLLRKCVDIPTVMSYVKLSPTFRSRIPENTYVPAYVFSRMWKKEKGHTRSLRGIHGIRRVEINGIFSP